MHEQNYSGGVHLSGFVFRYTIAFNVQRGLEFLPSSSPTKYIKTPVKKNFVQSVDLFLLFFFFYFAVHALLFVFPFLSIWTILFKNKTANIRDVIFWDYSRLFDAVSSNK